MQRSPWNKAALVFVCAGTLLSLCCGGSGKQPPENQRKIAVHSYFHENQFNGIFPLRDRFYSYSAFIKAVDEIGHIRIHVIRRAVSVYQISRTDTRTGRTVTVRQDPDWNEDWAKKRPDSSYFINYGDFCSGPDLASNKRELAAFLANVAHETRHGENGQYNDGLMYRHEGDTTLSYIAENDTYPPVTGRKYYGRGPLQLSYNGNYGYASDCLFGNKMVLLNNPSLLETDPVLAFEAAIYFWMTPQTYKPSAHDAMIGKWKPGAPDAGKHRRAGFGLTIDIINGAVECGKGNQQFSMNDRIAYYRHFLEMLGASDPNCACSCGDMSPY